MIHKVIPYNPRLKQLAKNLRNHSTLSEVLLWQQLKNKRIEGCDFHRQRPIENYILDFFCDELLLGIEIDGITHENKYYKDIERQKELEKYGISFLRFQDIEVKRNMEGVVETIRQYIKEHKNKHVSL